MKIRRNILFSIGIILAVLIVAGLMHVYARFNPEDSVWFPKCLFFTLTGLKCPGCGVQRAVHSLLNLDFAAAFRYNAYLFVAIPVLMAFAFDFLTGRRLVAFHNFINGRYFVTAIGVSVLLWWIGRNILDI